MQFKQSAKYSWVHLLGPFVETETGISFKGREIEPTPPSQPADQINPRPRNESEAVNIEKTVEKRGILGQSICDRRFTEGRISARINFAKVEPSSLAEIVLQYDPVTGDMLNAGLGGYKDVFFSVRKWTTIEDTGPNQSSQRKEPQPKNWKNLRSGGDRGNLRSGVDYDLEVLVRGSLITLSVNGVEVGSAELPNQLNGYQVGVFCDGTADIEFTNFLVQSAVPQAFVVMQFNTPDYEELFTNVIAPVCDKMGLKAFRATETYSPGLIVADIAKQISESRVIIAEITPVNANVYYEVGYADALRKPVILIADKRTKDLPFDVRPYRTIFYENSIGGKNKVEETLEKYLSGIMSQRT